MFRPAGGDDQTEAHSLTAQTNQRQSPSWVTSKLEDPKSLSITDYGNLMTGADNEASDEWNLQRQRDYVLDIVQRMVGAIREREIKCMEPFVREVRHMIIEGMFFTETHIYV